jgi:hypothetical protein
MTQSGRQRNDVVNRFPDFYREREWEREFDQYSVLLNSKGWFQI